MSDALLEIRGLVAGYGDISVVHGIDLEVHEGEVVGLFGPNGAGKTTTLLTISGLVQVLGGSIHACGKTTSRLASHEISRLGIAHVPEDRSLFTQLTVAENLRLGRRRGSRADADTVLKYFPALAGLKSRQAGLLSGGEQQMLAIARALLGSPKLLIVDEMSLGLAPVIVKRLLPILRQVAQETGAGVLFVEQHVHMALEVADRAYVMSRGEITLAGAAAELRGRRDLIEASYLGDMRPA
jgi:branched-chain amino acid transport system ATP-binding protein